MNNVDLEGINRLLARVPEYRAALNGVSLPGAPFSTPTNMAQRAQNARWAAKQYGDITIPSGQITASGEVVDPNRTHWYTDPRILGPAAVAAATGIGLLALGPAATGAAAADGLLPSSTIPGAASAVPATVASQGASAGIPYATATATASPFIRDAVKDAASPGDPGTDTIYGSGLPGHSLTDILKNLATPENALKVAGLLAASKALANGSGGGGGNSPFGGNSALMDGITEDMAAARKRYQQAQPLYDTAINMAYGRTPSRYRGAPPEGYSSGGDASPAGAYQYQMPKFT